MDRAEQTFGGLSESQHSDIADIIMILGEAGILPCDSEYYVKKGTADACVSTGSVLESSTSPRKGVEIQYLMREA